MPSPTTDRVEVLREELQAVRAKGTRLNLADRTTLLANLRFTYHLTRAGQLLLATAKNLVFEGPELRAYYTRHEAEETGHDEWLLRDLQSASFNPFPCPTYAAALAGMQYYHLLHTGPASLLGYLLVLEGFPAPMAVIETLEDLHGPELLRTSRFHAEADIKHGAEVWEIVTTLSPRDFAIARQVALQSQELLNEGMIHATANL